MKTVKLFHGEVTLDFSEVSFSFYILPNLFKVDGECPKLRLNILTFWWCTPYCENFMHSVLTVVSAFKYFEWVFVEFLHVIL